MTVFEGQGRKYLFNFIEKINVLENSIGYFVNKLMPQTEASANFIR